MYTRASLYKAWALFGVVCCLLLGALVLILVFVYFEFLIHLNVVLSDVWLLMCLTEIVFGFVDFLFHIFSYLC